jgi:hypothetical protein
MSPLSLFLVEVGISVFSSTLVVAFLTRPLRRLLIDACRSTERANFWVAYSDAMIFIAPPSDPRERAGERPWGVPRRCGHRERPRLRKAPGTRAGAADPPQSLRAAPPR